MINKQHKNDKDKNIGLYILLFSKTSNLKKVTVRVKNGIIKNVNNTNSEREIFVINSDL